MEKIPERELKCFYEEKKKNAFRIQILFLMGRLTDHKKLLNQCKQKEKEEADEVALSSSEEPGGIFDGLSLSSPVTVEGVTTSAIAGNVNGKGEEDDVEMASPLLSDAKGPYWFLQERSIYEDQVFAKAQFHSGKMGNEEWVTYETVWNAVVPEEAPHDFLIYLKTDPRTCMDRITSRGGGIEGIDLDYLKTLEMEYEDWVKQTMPNHMVVFRVDWTKPSKDLEGDIKTTWKLITKMWLNILRKKTAYKAPYPIIDIVSPSLLCAE